MLGLFLCKLNCEKNMKWSINITAVLIAVFACTPVFATSTLIIPESVKLLAVNMETPTVEGGFFSDHKTVELPNGTNQIVFKYQPEFEIGDDIKAAYSSAIIAKFDVLDEEVKFDLPKFKSYRDAQSNISLLKWKLLNDQGIAIDFQEDVLMSTGVQIGRNYPQEARNYNINGGPASVAVTYVTTNQFDQPILKSEPHSEAKVFEQLKAMYKQAPIEEQSAFKAWVLKN